MCGRFGLSKPDRLRAALYGVDGFPPLPPRFNIAPGQDVLVVRGAAEAREALTLRWGLVPFWSKEVGARAQLANARAESVLEKPTFRTLMQKGQRCVILGDVFYEWQATTGRVKQPYAIRRRDGEPFAFAGLWDRWTRGDAPLESCTILTTDANDTMSPIHHRMPVMISTDRLEEWLNPATPAAALLSLLRPAPAAWLDAYPVSTYVNAPTRDDDRCVAPLASET